MPHVETALIPNAVHLLIMEQPEAVNEHILAFLSPPAGMSKLKNGEVPLEEKNIERVAVG